MYTGTSATFNSKVTELSRTFSAKLVISATSSITVTDGIRSVKFSGGTNGADKLTIGSTVCSSVEIEVDSSSVGVTNLSGLDITLSFGLLLDNGTTEYIPYGKYFVTSVDVNDYTLKISACDVMYKAEKLYSSSLTYPATAIQMIDDICSKIGITRATTGLGTITISTKPAGYTMREMLGYLSSLYGKFACINRLGKLEIRWYENNGATTDYSRCAQPTVSQDTYTLGFVSVTKKDNTVISAGTGATGIHISNPFMTQTMLNNLWTNTLSGFSYTGADVKIMLADPRVDGWDLVTVQSGADSYISVPCMTYTLDFDGGLSAEIKANAETEQEAEINYKGPNIVEKERIYEEFLTVNTLLANTADTEYLEATYATINSLDAVTARIGTIEADYVTAEYASLNYADINLANIANGSIKNAMIDTGAVGTAQIADGSITDAKIVGLTATKILAGTLDAGIVNVINLNCANLTVGTINGQQIADNAVTYGKIASTAVKSITDTIDIGGTNLLLNSGVEVSSNAFLVAIYTPSTPLVVGETYTISICVTPASGVTYLAPFMSNGYCKFRSLYVTGTGKQIVTATFVASYASGRTPEDNASNAIVRLYRYPNDGTVTGNTTIHWIKVEKGNKATDYSPAPEDITVENVYTPGTKTIAGAKITPLTLTENLIATGAITTDKIVANAITAAKIAANTITANEIAANTITATELNVSTLSAISANLGTVTAGVIQSANYVSGTSGMKLTLSTGAWDSAYFKLSANGTLTATAGTIGGFAITSNLLYAQTTAGYTTLKTGGDVAIACGSPSYSNTSGAAMQIYHNGQIRIGSDTSNQIRLDTGHMDFYYGSTYTGRIGQTGDGRIAIESTDLYCFKNLSVNGNIYLDTFAKYLYGQGDKRLIGVSSAGNLVIGADTNIYDINIYAGTGYVTNLFAGSTKAAYVDTGGVYLPNAKYIIGVTTEGTTSNLIGCTSSNNVAVNSDNVGNTNIYGTTINLMPGGTKVASFDNTGLSFVNGCGVVCNSSIAMRWYSNALYVGIDTQPLKLVGTSITAPTFNGLTTTGLTVNGTATMAGLTVNGGATAYALTTSYNINVGLSLAVGSTITAGGNITMTENATYLYGKSTSAESQRLIGVTSSNNIALGSPDNAGSLNAYVPTEKTINAYIGTTRIAYVDSGGIKLTSGKYLYMIDGSDNLLRAVSVYTTNQLGFGSSDITSQLLGTFKGTVSASSDRRAKHDIISLSDKYTAMLDHLDAVSYQYNAPLDGRYNVTNCGFIAQDVLSALSAVGLTAQDFGGFVDSDNMYALDYTQFVPILWAIVKKQQEQIKSLLTE